MSFGSCCIFNERRYSLMKAKSVDVKGEELGLFVNFEVCQTFYHDESTAKEVTYIFPNDLKMCIYDTTFVVGDEIIKPKLQSKEEAKKTYEEAVKAGHTAVYGSNFRDGLTKFKLGNVPPNTDCKVIIKVAFTANVTKQNSFYIKFPLDVCTPSGSRGCLDMISSNFQFQLQCDKEKVNKVTSNVKNIQYDNSTKLLTINDRVKNNNNEHSIIITFETQDNIESSVLIGDTTNGYDNCAVTISPNLEEKRDNSSTEFIFVVDCSGSMSGNSIRKAGECLELFIRSLPDNSYFNIIRFGSSYEKLFNTSVEYNETNMAKALKLSSNLQANLGGTEIYRPLKDVYDKETKFGQRQIFILTDGEVENRTKVLELVSLNSNQNRCFTIGIGRGCDAGLVEGIADSSGGKSDFVQSGDSIAEKVIPQLETSLNGVLKSLEIHIEGEENDSFQVSPFPLPSLSPKGATIIYIRDKQKEKNNRFENNFLVTANLGEETVEIPILENKRIEIKEEDKFGCSEGKNIGKAILPLFAYNLIKKYERKSNISDEEKKNAIELSISSGVLCKFTGYVGLSEKANTDVKSVNKSDDESSSFDFSSDSSSDRLFCSKKKCKGRIISDSSSDSSSDRIRSSKAKCKVRKSPDSDDDSDDNIIIRNRRRPGGGAGGRGGCGCGRGRGCDRAEPKRSQEPLFNKLKDEDKAPEKMRKTDSSSSDFGEEELSNKKEMAPSKPTKIAKSSSSEEEENPVPKKKAPKPMKKIKSLFSEEEEEEKPVPKKKAPKPTKKMSSKMRFKPTITKIESSSSDDEEITKNAKKEKIETDNKEEVIMKSKPKRKSFDLMALLRLQNLHGFWEDLDEINAMLGSDISSIKGVDVTPKNLNTNCVSTILAIAALHVKANDQKNIWTMIEQKAIKWLTKNLQGVDIDQLIKDTESLI